MEVEYKGCSIEIIVLFFCIALILISITGCSKISKGKGKTIEQKYYVNQEREFQLGDIVEKKEPLQGNEENISIRYTVNQATLYNNPTEASVRKEDDYANY